MHINTETMQTHIYLGLTAMEAAKQERNARTQYAPSKNSCSSDPMVIARTPSARNASVLEAFARFFRHARMLDVNVTFDDCTLSVITDPHNSRRICNNNKTSRHERL